MASRSVITTDHDEITSWVQRRGGIPCRIRTADGAPGHLCIDLPGAEVLEALDWEHWFEQFDDSGLAFCYEIESENGADRLTSQLIQRGAASA